MISLKEKVIYLCPKHQLFAKNLNESKHKCTHIKLSSLSSLNIRTIFPPIIAKFWFLSAKTLWTLWPSKTSSFVINLPE
jgi:hypothetical protein